LCVLLLYILLIGAGLLIAWYLTGFGWPRKLDDRVLRGRRFRRRSPKGGPANL